MTIVTTIMLGLIYVDVSVDTLRTRLRQGRIYGVEKIEQSLNNFFRKGNRLNDSHLRRKSGDRAGSPARQPRWGARVHLPDLQVRGA
jgi:two-component system sensor histidine kinase KdpD